MVKTLTNFEIANIIAYTNREDSIVRNMDRKMSTKFMWNLRKNLKKITELNETFNAAQTEISQFYSSDEYSYQKDNDRIVKDEYVAEYNDKLQELYNQENEVRIDTVKIDEITSDPTKLDLSFAELDTLSFMIEDVDNEGNPEDVEIEELGND